MNTENKLVNLLDKLFGLKNKTKSSYRVVSQDFDERTNEHVALIEYRFRGKGPVVTKPVKKQNLLKELNRVF
ncbi:MAG: hypothetical protein QF877_16800 [Gammaproteobacteria bacterium]|jgi:hypothetical protein|nr:hypothetical protein [Chromatiales bacterium]MDP6734365.1 hypothetical protein [Gammaproteobacteria bacterium]